MTQPVRISFLAFRKRLMFRFCAALIAVSVGFKYFNLAFAYMTQGEQARIEEVPGMSLLVFAPNINWQTALEIGAIATVAAAIGLAGMYFINRLRVRGTNAVAIRPQQLKLETQVYATLFAVSLIGGVVTGQNGLFISLTIFLPLISYTLLNPAWGTHREFERMLIGIGLPIVGFILAGSKTIIFALLVGILLSRLYNRQRIWKTAVVLLIFVIVYPYLNIFRGAISNTSANFAGALVLNELNKDFSTIGVFGLLRDSYSAILNRIVGLDGLLVANSLFGHSFANRAEASFTLVGYSGVGISLSTLGQLSLHYQDLGIAMLVYPAVVMAGWLVAVLLDAYFQRLGFFSAGTFVYLKVGQLLLGGFREADMKITLASISLILLCAIVLHQLRRSKAGRKAHLTNWPFGRNP